MIRFTTFYLILRVITHMIIYNDWWSNRSADLLFHNTLEFSLELRNLIKRLSLIHNCDLGIIGSNINEIIFVCVGVWGLFRHELLFIPTGSRNVFNSNRSGCCHHGLTWQLLYWGVAKERPCASKRLVTVKSDNGWFIIVRIDTSFPHNFRRQ
jgi:hypothetical protein